MTASQAEDLPGMVFKGLPLASGSSWEQSVLTGEGAETIVPLQGVKVALAWESCPPPGGAS